MKNNLLYPELSYALIGICFETHNELGRYAKEKQYGDFIEKRLKELKIPYKREMVIANTGNIADFFIDNKIILEIKSKRILTRDDYYQIQRYLQICDIKLGFLINFRSEYLVPKRVIKIETINAKKYFNKN